MANYEIPQNKQAEKVVYFANRLHLCGDYHGQLTRLRQWQELIFRPLFGRVDADGRRLIKRCLLLLPRKSSKTQMCAIICLYALLTFGENQIVLSAAASQEQATRVYDAMVEIIQQDDHLSDLLTIQKHKILFKESNSFYAAVTSGGAASHGYNPTVVVLDEFHAWIKPVHIETFKALSTGRGARKEPLLIMISTQTSDRYSLAGQEFDMCRQLKGRIENGEVKTDGTITNPNYLAVLYFANPDDDWHDETLWHRVSPALGDFVSLDEYREQHQIACDIPARASYFKCLYLNMPADADERWLDLDKFKACYGKIPDEQLKDSKVWCGLDYAPIYDLTCFAILHDLEDGRLYLRILSWCSQESIQIRSRLEKVPYDQWQKKQWIRATDGNQTDEKTVTRDIIEALTPYSVQAVGADKSYAISVGQNLLIEGIPVEWFIQGWKSFGPAVVAMEKAIIGKKVIIEPNPVLEYCIHNTRMERDAADNQKPSNALKQRTEKIDAAVAAIMAFGMWFDDQIPEKPSIYENPDTQLWY